jgi:hypothetical protein
MFWKTPVVFVQNILLECLKNRMKKEQQGLTSLDEIFAVRSRFSHKGSGRKRATSDLPCVNEGGTSSIIHKTRKVLEVFNLQHDIFIFPMCMNA